MKRKEAIKRTREGVVQIFNDYHPSTKEIKKFLKEAFPEDKMEENNTYILNEFFRKDSVCYELWFSSNNNFNLPVINISTITKRKKTKLKQLERQFSDLAIDVSELRQTLAKNVEVDVEEVKSELIVGEWYKWKYPAANLIFRITKIGRIYIYNYGIEDGEWSERVVCKDNNFEKATPQEVQTALENEAKKRGFKNGAIINNSSIGFCFNELYLDTNLFEWDGTYLNIGKEKLAIFKDGIWAELIQQETIKEEEIDFSVQDLFIYERGTYIVCSNGKQNLDENTFEGKVIYSTGVHQDINIFSKNWSKRAFKPFKGELTIK